ASCSSRPSIVKAIVSRYDGRNNRKYALPERLEALLHLLGRDVLPVQRCALSEVLGAFERTDDDRIEAGIADQTRCHRQRILIIACDGYGHAGSRAVGIAR